ncbi:DUF222 domain-containing protein, partial [Specibacter cremeus]|uniref:DUF222 domain-containing protein n=1 Tax=Specibacter cremeus TaxID=1629051 RepID=UPI000F78DDD8
MGTRELAAAARAAAYAADPAAFVKRHTQAVTNRHVSLRPAPDGMTWLSALLPLTCGVTILKTLTGLAATATAAGDPRSKGQLMADALIHRLTTHAPCSPTDAPSAEVPGTARDPGESTVGPGPRPRFTDLAGGSGTGAESRPGQPTGQ